ncbi:protein adenylyltransferase SelO [Janthinobacterium sp. 17J80-10]|uniref:protein adenylyltransferase SelO n=1 Tax=Janthinobacterium sp. 17J80-10 TaxID=2497863 RepID=UPI0010056ADD|nr:YdiU family protein [Janthinobacterium sp. 17J80-10]QAU34423.1 YdiU family protein [Janthinobacterium sp. 17J80-10]
MIAPGLPAATLLLEQLPFSHSFGSLPPAFFTRLQPTPMPAPYLVCASEAAAALIGLNPAELTTPGFAETFAGNRILPATQPLAAVYSGHQFGVWAGQLGDGRAILLGEVAAEAPGGALEIQLKGAGLTPYSRMGDGRAVLRSSIREYLCSEAMAALGIPTSRALCVVGSDQLVMRETPESSAVATRLAPTFIRFGSFEHWYYQDKTSELKTLADYVIARFYPELQDEAKPYQALLTEITRRTARLVAQWQAVGFMHGVLNTDNMSILGITIDYGPFGFMEAFDAGHICNHSDSQGRYAYAMQPKIGHWNCYALGQALLPLIGEVDDVHAALAGYADAYQEKIDELLHAKLGLQRREEGDSALIDGMFKLLQDNHADFTLFFRRLGDLQQSNPAADSPLRDLFIDRAAFDAWVAQYRLRLGQESSNEAARRAAMHAVNPKYVLRNYLAQVAIEKAQDKDFSEIARLQKILEHPFDEQPEHERYAALPPDWASQLEVSCSS